MKKFSDKRGSKEKEKSKVSRNYSILYVFLKVVVMVMAAAIYCAMVLFLRGLEVRGVERRDRFEMDGYR